MRATLVRAHGGLEALESVTLPDPVPGPGEILVEVHACALNHLDLWVRRGVPGHSFPLPLIPGSDVAGVVRELGPGAAGVSPGDAVVIAPAVSCGRCLACLSGRDQHCEAYAILGEHRHGGCAELLSVPAANVVKKPAALGFVEAAAFGVSSLTAWHMLVVRAVVRPAEVVLVVGAGSGVGSAAIQIAKLHGARVIATSSSADKRTRALELGADAVLDSADPELAHQVRALSDGRGADIVVEHVGAATWETSLRCLAREGRLVTCGATTGAGVRLDLRHLFFKNQSVLGSTMGSKGEFRHVIGLAGRGLLRPVVGRVLPMAETATAQRLLEERAIFGKIVLALNGE